MGLRKGGLGSGLGSGRGIERGWGEGEGGRSEVSAWGRIPISWLWRG